MPGFRLSWEDAAGRRLVSREPHPLLLFDVLHKNKEEWVKGAEPPPKDGFLR